MNEKYSKFSLIPNNTARNTLNNDNSNINITPIKNGWHLPLEKIQIISWIAWYFFFINLLHFYL